MCHWRLVDIISSNAFLSNNMKPLVELMMICQLKKNIWTCHLQMIYTMFSAQYVDPLRLSDAYMRTLAN